MVYVLTFSFVAVAGVFYYYVIPIPTSGGEAELNIKSRFFKIRVWGPPAFITFAAWGVILCVISLLSGLQIVDLGEIIAIMGAGITLSVFWAKAFTSSLLSLVIAFLAAVVRYCFFPEYISAIEESKERARDRETLRELTNNETQI